MASLSTPARIGAPDPRGVYLARSYRGGGLTVIAANTSRAFPTLALLTIFAISPIGFGNRATVLAVAAFAIPPILTRSEEHTSELQSRGHLVCRLPLETKHSQAV